MTLRRGRRITFVQALFFECRSAAYKRGSTFFSSCRVWERRSRFRKTPSKYCWPRFLIDVRLG